MNSSGHDRLSINWGDVAVTAASLAIGIFFFTFSFSIDESLAGSGVGPRLVPQVISVILILFAVTMLAKTFYQRFAAHADDESAMAHMDSVADELDQANEVENGTYDIEHSDAKPGLGVRLLPLQILCISALYVLMFQWFGYLLATLICAVPIYSSFGNRGSFSLLVVPLIAIALFYSLFFGAMGLFDLPGSLIDTTQWFRW